MLKKIIIAVALTLALALTGCVESEASSDKVQKQQQETLSKQANAVVGMPAITNFQEKRILKDIIEMRDKAIVTVTYTLDMNGVLHKLCDSVGFGISAATQYTNPQKIADWSHNVGYAILPQADPNGLFSPTSAEGTWVMCKDPNGKDVAPVYVEPRIIVSKFPLK